jgi:hypothetical protein
MNYRLVIEDLPTPCMKCGGDEPYLDGLGEPVCPTCDWETLISLGSCVGLFHGYKDGTRRCERVATFTTSDGTGPFCPYHWQMILTEATDRALLDIRAELDRKAKAEARRNSEANKNLVYVQRGDFIRIGVTPNVATYLRSVRKGSFVGPFERDSELQPDGPIIPLAIRQGGEREKYRMYRRFDHLRAAGEWFTKGQDLLDHIDAINATQTDRNQKEA